MIYELVDRDVGIGRVVGAKLEVGKVDAGDGPALAHFTAGHLEGGGGGGRARGGGFSILCPLPNFSQNLWRPKSPSSSFHIFQKTPIFGLSPDLGSSQKTSRES